jgi:hypothetical protein
MPAEGTPIHDWHHKVGENKIGLRINGLFQTCLPIPSQQHGVALILQHLLEHIQDRLLIVNDENDRVLTTWRCGVAIWHEATVWIHNTNLLPS